MPLVSIVIPVYNVEDKIERCIESVVNQSVEDIEIILVNDGSTDKSGNICDEYASSDKRVQVLHLENSGVSATRNLGIENSISDYILFIDSDDSVSEKIVEELLNAIKIGDCDFAMCGYTKYLVEGENITKIKYKCSNFTGSTREYMGNIEKYLTPPLLQGPCWKLFKREVIIENGICFPEDMSYGEDTYFVYTYLKFSKNVTTINIELYNYFSDLHFKSLSSVFRQDKYTINLKLVVLLKDLLKKHNIEDSKKMIEELVAGMYISFIGELCSTNSLNLIQKFKIIKECSNLEFTQRAFRVVRDNSYQNTFINFCINYKFELLIEAFFILKMGIKKRSESLYSFLSNSN